MANVEALCRPVQRQDWSLGTAQGPIEIKKFDPRLCISNQRSPAWAKGIQEPGLSEQPSTDLKKIVRPWLASPRMLAGLDRYTKSGDSKRASDRPGSRDQCRGGHDKPDRIPPGLLLPSRRPMPPPAIGSPFAMGLLDQGHSMDKSVLDTTGQGSL